MPYKHAAPLELCSGGSAKPARHTETPGCLTSHPALLCLPRAKRGLSVQAFKPTLTHLHALVPKSHCFSMLLPKKMSP